MQLSLSPSPAESILAAQLLGGEASGTAAFDGYSGAPGAPFAVLFPGLASATAPATPPAPGKPGAALSAPGPWTRSPRAPVASPPNSIFPPNDGSRIARPFPIAGIATITTAAVVGAAGAEHSGEPDQPNGFSEECSDPRTSRREDQEAPGSRLDSLVGTVLPFLPIPPSELIGALPLAASAPTPRVETALVTDAAAEPPAFGASSQVTPHRAATSLASAASDQAVSSQPARRFPRPAAAADVVSSQAIPTALSSPVTPEGPRQERFRDLAELPAPRGEANERRTFSQAELLSRPVPVGRDPATRDDSAALTGPHAPGAPDSGSVPLVTESASKDSERFPGSTPSANALRLPRASGWGAPQFSGRPVAAAPDESPPLRLPLGSGGIAPASVEKNTSPQSARRSAGPLHSLAARASVPSDLFAHPFTASSVPSAVDDLSTLRPPVGSAAMPATARRATDDFIPIKLATTSGVPFVPAAPHAFTPAAVFVPSFGPYPGQPAMTLRGPMFPAPRVSAVPEASSPLPVVSEITVAAPTPAVSLPIALTAASLPGSGGAPLTPSPLAMAARESASVSRSEKSSTARGAKIAALNGIFSTPADIDQSNFDKTFLNVSKQGLTVPAADVGTGVANSDVAMSAATIFNRPAPTAVLEHAPVATWPVTPVAGSPDFSAPAGFGPATSATAQQAIEAVLTAAEQFTSRAQQSVKLHFSVGGTDLSVRVELRANQVHATFHSDSPELNSALAHAWQGSALTHEWQGAALAQMWTSANGAESGDRSPRFAAPVFTGSSQLADDSAFTGFTGGDASSQQRGTGARHDDENAAAFGRRGRAASLAGAGTAAGTDSTSPAVPVAARGTRPTASARLSTHA